MNSPEDLIADLERLTEQGQLKSQLQPVLRAADYDGFVRERAIAALQEIMDLHQSR